MKILPLVVVLVVPLVATPAVAAGPARTVKAPVDVQLVKAAGRSGAWAFGFTGDPYAIDSELRPVALHWNGKRLKRIPLPAGLKGTVSDAAFSSARSGWAVGGYHDKGWVLRWNGSAWRLVKKIRTGIYPVIVRARPGSLVLSGQDDLMKPSPRFLRFDGRSWTKSKARVFLDQVSGSFAIGSAQILDDDPAALVRWNGRSWAKVRVSLPKPAQGYSTYLSTVTSRGAAEAWLIGQHLDFIDRVGATFLLRWNGKRWTREKVPITDGFVDAATADGRGGLWVAAAGRLLHRTSRGAWRSITAVPLTTLDRAPGTNVLWGAGQTTLLTRPAT